MVGGDFMDKKLISFFIVLLIVTSTGVANGTWLDAQVAVINYSLIMSISPSINKALPEIYRYSKGCSTMGRLGYQDSRNTHY